MAIYGTFKYGQALYGLSHFPTSDPWDVYDFCYPDDSSMLSMLSWSEAIPARAGAPYSWFNANNDYCMRSDDGLDSGFRFNYSIPYSEFSFQFTFLPSELPADFSSPADQRFFVGAFNQFGACVGLLISENGGLALSEDGVTVSSVFPDSADIFAEGSDYYTIRVVVNEVANRANLYASRKDVYAATGVLELRYTFELLKTPAIEVDNFRVEVVGQPVLNRTTVCLDCFRMSSELVYGNRRPVAVIGEDKARVLTQYGSFDGRSSYDPDTPPQPLTYAWTVADVPNGSGALLAGQGSTPADASGYTNIIEGAPGTFDAVLEGDFAKGDLPLDSIVMRVADDGSWVALNRDAMVAGSALVSWSIISQAGWGGTRLAGTTLIDVLARLATPPAAPTIGDKYLIIPTATHGWATHEGEVATYSGGNPALELSWGYELFAAGEMVFVVAERDSYRTTGSGTWRLSDPKIWELDVWEGRLAVVGSYLGDVLGLFTVELVVNDGVRNSLPAEALLNIYQTSVPLGLTPDLSFIWNYLPDVWGLVDDKEKIGSFWSGASQSLTDELMNLWQRAYSKSLLDVQRVFQRRWLNYDPWYEEPNYDELPAAINNAVNAAGFADSPTPTSVPGDPLDVDPEHAYVLNSVSGTGDTITQDSPAAGTATLDDSAGMFTPRMVGQNVEISGATTAANNGVFEITVVNGPTQLEYSNVSAVTVTEAFSYTIREMPKDVLPGHYLALDGVAYRILRAEGDTLITAHILPTTDRPSYWMIRPTVTSRVTNFTLVGAAIYDTAVFEVRTEDGDTSEIPAIIFGVRGKVLVFDDATSALSGYLASDKYTVRFKGVLRRSAIAVDDLVMNIPRLQEAIKLLDDEGPISDVPSPLYEGKDFRVEVVSTAEDT